MAPQVPCKPDARLGPQRMAEPAAGRSGQEARKRHTSSQVDRLSQGRQTDWVQRRTQTLKNEERKGSLGSEHD